MPAFQTLPELLLPVLRRWGSQPEACAQRLAGELWTAGHAIVPIDPSEAMIQASLRALRRHGIRWGVTDIDKHRLRLQDAVRTGHVETLIGRSFRIEG